MNTPTPDYSLWIAFAALFVSAAGPFFTALINSIHESRMSKKRFVQEHEHQVIERYLKAVGKYVFTTEHSDMREFGECSSEIFMYAPEELWDDIRDLNKKITEYRQCDEHSLRMVLKQNNQKLYFELCEKFADYRRSSKRKYKRRCKKTK